MGKRRTPSPRPTPGRPRRVPGHDPGLPVHAGITIPGRAADHRQPGRAEHPVRHRRLGIHGLALHATSRSARSAAAASTAGHRRQQAEQPSGYDSASTNPNGVRPNYVTNTLCTNPAVTTSRGWGRMATGSPAARPTPPRTTATPTSQFRGGRQRWFDRPQRQYADVLRPEDMNRTVYPPVERRELLPLQSSPTWASGRRSSARSDQLDRPRLAERAVRDHWRHAQCLQLQPPQWRDPTGGRPVRQRSGGIGCRPLYCAGAIGRRRPLIIVAAMAAAITNAAMPATMGI